MRSAVQILSIIALLTVPVGTAFAEPGEVSQTRNLIEILEELEAGHAVELELTFETNSARLVDGQAEQLDQLVQLFGLEELAEYRIAVHGHTDAVGAEDYNQSLSEQRAQAVAGSLIDRGIDPERLEIAGFGETHLKLPEAPRDGANRRVEIRRL